MEHQFVIKSWAAVAPGLRRAEQWQAWARAPWLPHGDEVPEVRDMPAMSRRRLNALGRMAAQVCYDVQAQIESAPTIFASRYGDAVRSLALLGELVAGDAISPTAFGLSVHNAIGAMVSMARGDRANMLALAGGAASASAGLLEAAALLADGAQEVVLVQCDAPLPEDYAHFQDEPMAPYAWALKLARPSAYQAADLGLRWGAPTEEAAEPSALPWGLEVLRAALQPGHSVQRTVRGVTWQVRHHA